MARLVSKRGAHSNGGSRSVAIHLSNSNDSSSSSCPCDGTEDPSSAPLSSLKLPDALRADDDRPRALPSGSSTARVVVHRNTRNRKHTKGSSRARRSSLDYCLTGLFNVLLFGAISIIVLTTVALTQLSSSSPLMEGDGGGGSGGGGGGPLAKEWGAFLKQSHLVTQRHHRTGVRGSLAAFAASGAGAASAADDEDRGTFPSPAEAAGPDALPLLAPTFGSHRPTSDAVFAFAEGYDLGKFVVFVRSLRDVAGFDGDVVLAVSSTDRLSDGVEEYLRSQPNVVVYALGWKCFDRKGGDPVDTPKPGVGCNLDGIYGRATGGGGGTTVVEAVDDPRPARPLATARFELYWVWSTRYAPRSRMLLVDFRDTYFQRSPFDGITAMSQPAPATSDGNGDGVLYFFEEDENTRIRDSTYNQDWLRSAYGQETLQSMWKDKIVCSGATLGEQVAVEAYLRAMVHEFDSTKCMKNGCDQGMHNYLVRRGGFAARVNDGGNNDENNKRPLPAGIGNIVVVGQGMGAVNNLGALRNRGRDLKGLGLYEKDDTHFVLNWDGSVSPVVHQWDRHKEVLGPVLQYRRTKWMREWRNNRK